MNKQTPPIKCKKCGSTKIREVMSDTTLWNNFEWNGEAYELKSEDAEGGYCNIECLDCGEEYGKADYDKWIEQTRLYVNDKQTW